MSCEIHNSAAMTMVVRRLAVLSLAWTAFFPAPALAVDAGDIVLVSVKGEVSITMQGAVRDVRAGNVLELPATLRTGLHGTAELRQGGTTLSVGPETVLEFPALEKRGAPIDNIKQPRGSAFYDIGKRDGRKLRVETPWMVGVVKGTQFSVVVEDGSATISLFEGLLDVRSADGSSAVELKAGETAAIRSGDASISVAKMGSALAPAGIAPGGEAMSMFSVDVSAEQRQPLADLPGNPDAQTYLPVTADAAPRPGAPAVEVPGTVDPDVGVDVDAPLIDTGGDDDGNNGHGNDADGTDSSNPGRGSDNRGRGKP